MSEKCRLSLTDQTNLLPFRKVVIVFSSLSLCILVSTLDSTIVATALPTISNHFNAGSIASWVPSAYFLTSTAFQPLWSLLAGFSPSILSLIIFRGITGAGGGGIVSMVQIVMSDVVSLRERGKYQGIIGVVVAFGFAIGPFMGGALAEKVSWRENSDGRLPRHDPYSGWLHPGYLAVDMGRGDFPLELCRCSCTLDFGVLRDWIVLCMGMEGSEATYRTNVYFRHVTVTGVYITMFINGAVFYSQLYYLPQYFQVALDYSPIRSGVFLFPVLVTQTLASWITGQIISRTGHYRTIIHVGFAVWAIASGCLSTITESTAKGLMVFFMLLAGAGAGQTLQTTTVAAQASVSRKDMSVVTAVRNFVRLLGGTLSLAIGATIINNSLRHSMTTLSLPSSTIKKIIDDPTILGDRLSNSTSTPLEALGITPAMASYILDGYTRGFRIVFILNACLAAVATLASITMIKHKELTRSDDEERKLEAKGAMGSESDKVEEKGRSKLRDDKADLIQALLEPFTHISSIKGKEIRPQMIEAFNLWLKVPDAKLRVIAKVVSMLHTASLLVDDIEDDAQLRRGVPAAHKIYGIPQTINCANYAYFLAYQELFSLRDEHADSSSDTERKSVDQELDRLVTSELLCLHRGQGLEILWRDSLQCPTEAEYISMVNNKTGGLFRVGIKLMMACATQNTDVDYVPLVNMFGVYFQIRDDYMNLQSGQYAANKGFAEDLTEGKFSFPVVHGVRADPTNRQIMSNVSN
ncbi:hypothetical protein NLI96_g7519 [Meripilus lineatus]|uniref:(2E,6E)-farnesyl diphosphate synthase n=1 Tax=Meripilus lineatus TaxID=2056292 RepID=A0AAD5UZ22_9APHY|nr:hypothetical protein NLI96_g7519 [Physisporinus lineatus]